MHGRRDTTTLRPRPEPVVEATAVELGEVLSKPSGEPKTTTPTPQSFCAQLVLCPKDELPSRTTDIQKALAAATCTPGKQAAQHLLAAGFVPKAVKISGKTLWAYTKDGKAYTLPSSSDSNASASNPNASASNGQASTE